MNTQIQDISGNLVDVREGDLFAWNTPKSKLSMLIKIATSGWKFRKGINHVVPLGFSVTDLENDILELKGLSAGKEGVSYCSIDGMIADAKKTKSTLYHLPLSSRARELFDFGKYQVKGTELDGKPYGWIQFFIGVAVDDAHISFLAQFSFVKKWILKALRGAFHNEPIVMKKAVCSSVTAWQYIDALDEHLRKFVDQLNPNEQTPIDTASWNIYDDYNVITGKDRGIHKYRTAEILDGEITGV